MYFAIQSLGRSFCLTIEGSEIHSPYPQAPENLTIASPNQLHSRPRTDHVKEVAGAIYVVVRHFEADKVEQTVVP